jgi:RNA polymerase sigma-70 factor (ECF subfamily)
MAVDVENLYRTHGPMVLRRCRRLLRDEGKALDAMHDVFVEILRRKDTLDERAPAALLLQTATNVCLNRLRTQRRHPEDREETLLARIADASAGDAVETRSLARRMLQKVLGSEDAANEARPGWVPTGVIAVLHHVDGMTLEEVASEVGLSVSGVRKRLRTLKARLPGAEGASGEAGAKGAA